MKLVDIEPYKGKVIASHTYCGVNKLIEVDALEEISEQEIVKPILDKIRAEIIDTLYVDSLIFGEIIDFKNGKISEDDVIEEFNRITRLEVLEILKRNIGE